MLGKIVVYVSCSIDGENGTGTTTDVHRVPGRTAFWLLE
jgi:hypothetical protein